MASSSNVYIHNDHVDKTLWINWNGNRWTGSRITMKKDTADLLNIFLGIFIIFIEAAFWGYLSLALFFINHRRQRRDALHHQLQAAFRNVGSSLGTLTTLFKFWKVWGWFACWRRASLPAVAAIVCLAFFVGGMPFILAKSLLDNQGVEILIRNLANCGFWAAAFTNSSTTAAALLVNQSREAVSYVDLCYNENTPSNACDYHLATRRLPTLAVFPARCQFSPEACFYKNQYPSFQWQTDQLDSHVHFGINAPPRDRILLQRTTTCAPLDVDRVSNYESIAKPAYHIDVAWSHPANGSASTSSFTPIPELSRKDADVSIVFLNNQLVAIKGTDGPCSDPFFSATNKTMPLQKDYYLPDRPITAIGCTDQYAFGNPVTGQWTEPMSASSTSNWPTFTKGWNLSVAQRAAIASLQWSVSSSGGIEGVILGLEIDALLAKKSPGMFSDFQDPIPNDQWKKEVGYWFNIGLAKLQFGLIGIAVGPRDPTLPDLQNMLHTLTVGQKDLENRICTSQKAYSPDHKNYNAAGLITLLMQRIAIESVGVIGGTKWERLETDIPRMTPREASAGYLDIEHLDGDGRRHPKWST
ncbi:hypothetical protein BBO_07113 [Beauveria brongniartii RCEF 3172]|uniref:Uncharacterized protein n=1 Tax=Beauveria brongniartii RCEF 3172 TaxID=1081107 RepID=A0A167A246_9HYPO|nr:hypothetical protein BBO_07113 [Beauveria brongniartii RCEF 3172]